MQNYDGFLRDKATNTRTWATTGNTDVVTDVEIHPNSIILYNFTSMPAGRAWTIAVGQGTMTVTSSDVESSGLTYNYLIL